MSEIRAFHQIEPTDNDAVGGKGLSLGLLTRAGLPVPPGFCVLSSAYRRLKGQSLQVDEALTRQITAAYRDLGAGLVAVRSSATAEDGAVASFAGQQETILGVTGETAVLVAIARCWASLDSERAVAYRQRQGIDDPNLAMAVVVQRLVPAEVSGVLFTRDPLDPEGRRMLVEASWGLGESVVSGRVNPDRYHLDRETGAVLEEHIATKTSQITPTGQEEVPPGRQDQPCLDAKRLSQLAELGRRVEAFYGAARDVEWAWAEGRLWLLQARPITTAGAAEREQVRREELAALAARIEPSGTVWSRYNLAEMLPEPTPMTWAIVRRFMSGRGGYGLMYRDLGFDPDPALDDAGVFDLVCGRPYCNLSREPRMQYHHLPFGHSFAALKAAPQKALYPVLEFDPARAGFRFWLFLPIIFFQLFRSELHLRQLSRTFAQSLRKDILPAFAAETEQAANQDLAALDIPVLLERLEYWIQRTLYQFARDSLKPTVLAAISLARLKAGLLRILKRERAEEVLGELTMGARPDPEADLPAAIRDLASGRLERTMFLKRFGHRGSQEMELAQPRWAESPEALTRLLVQSGTSPGNYGGGELYPLRRPVVELPGKKGAALEPEIDLLRTYLGLRETAKHYFMKGYALIRRVLLELDGRHRLHGGIFFLTPEELLGLATGKDLTGLITQRRQRRTAALSLEVPQVLFSDDLEAIGRPAVVESGSEASVMQGVPLSAGVAEGPALVLHEPTPEAASGEPYILVCPSTDPAWVPLFVRARGLVMETGGVLSHGAIVAREFGLPAVAGLSNIHRRLRTGQRLRVDGGTGKVTVLADIS